MWQDGIIVGPVWLSGQVMSRAEVFGDSSPRSLLRELRTDIAMAVDDSFPLVYGLADKNIITGQLLKVCDSAKKKKQITIGTLNRFFFFRQTPKFVTWP